MLTEFVTWWNVTAANKSYLQWLGEV
jgi:hypothetical protein